MGDAQEGLVVVAQWASPALRPPPCLGVSAALASPHRAIGKWGPGRLLVRKYGSERRSKLPGGPDTRLNFTDDAPPQGPDQPQQRPNVRGDLGDPIPEFMGAESLPKLHLNYGEFCPLDTTGTECLGCSEALATDSCLFKSFCWDLVTAQPGKRADCLLPEHLVPKPWDFSPSPKTFPARTALHLGPT